MRSSPARSRTLNNSAYTNSIPFRTPLDVDVGVEVGQRELEAVEHGQELLDQAYGRPLHERGLLAQHALAVVLEVGLEPLRRAEQIVTFALEQVDVGDQLVGFVLSGGLRLVPIRVAPVRGGRIGKDGVVRVCGHGAYALCSSSTISASATSSSDVGAPESRATRSTCALLRLRVLVQPTS